MVLWYDRVAMVSKFIIHKKEAIKLRERGLTYGEINKILDTPIPKSTLAEWFKKIKLSSNAHERLKKVIGEKLKKAHLCSVEASKKRRQEYLNKIEKRIKHLKKHMGSKDIAKIVLAMLYLGEGAKNSRRAFVLGNSDPRIIRLYLRLLRRCYPIDEKKFRCTLQCRADQDIPFLEKFWSEKTQISLDQFYKARIDPRTVGKKSRKPEYKGVCRIDYFSADIYSEIEKIIEIVCNTGL
jgi:hypothetical protein